jgi:hypothetical protein
MSEKPPFDMSLFCWGVVIALLYLIIGRLEDVIKLLEANK